MAGTQKRISEELIFGKDGSMVKVLDGRKETKDFTILDTFFSGKVEFPDGVKGTIFIERNECDKMTIMLPEDR